MSTEEKLTEGLLPSNKTTSIENNSSETLIIGPIPEGTVAVRDHHPTESGLGSEHSTIFQNPYAALGQLAVSSMDALRDGIYTVMENSGGIKIGLVGTIMLSVPGVVLNTAISLKSEGVWQATISSTVGAVFQVGIITAGSTGTGGLGTAAAVILGTIAGDMANSLTDSVWKLGKELIYNLDEERVEPQEIKIDLENGTLETDLPLSQNYEILKSFKEENISVSTVKTSHDELSLESESGFDVLRREDGTVAFLADESGNFVLETNSDGNGTVTTKETGTIEFTAGDDVNIKSLEVCDSPSVISLGAGITLQRDPGFSENTNTCNQSITIEINQHQIAILDVDPQETIYSSTTYTIQPGDTLSAIAIANNTTVAELIQSNPEVIDPNQISAGGTLNLPQDKEDPGFSLEESGDTESDSTLSFEDLDSENGEFAGFGEEQQKADNPNGLAEPLVETGTATVTTPQLTPEQIEAAHQKEVDDAAAIRAADISVIGAQNNLEDALDSGDGLSIVKEGIDYYSSIDDRADLSTDNKNNQTEAVLDVVSSGISLGQSIDSGDGWGIAGDSINLIQDIDNYLAENTSDYSGLSGSASKALGLGVSGINFGRAIDSGDDMGLIQSSADLLGGIDNYLQGGTAAGTAFDEAMEIDAGSTGAAFKGIASAAGLAMNIASMDDVFESGDAGDIAYLAASTAHNAINTYNAIAHFSSLTEVGGNWVPGLGFVAAGVLLAQGDVVGAAFSAASAGGAMAVAAGLTTTGVGAVAGLALMAVSMLFGDDDPPEATASFTLDANGNVVMDVSGDSEMRDSAEAQGNTLLHLMQDYKSGGGRLLIDGHLPSFTVTQGEGSSLNYHSETGGKAAVILDDSVSQAVQLRGVLLALAATAEGTETSTEIDNDYAKPLGAVELESYLRGAGKISKSTDEVDTKIEQETLPPIDNPEQMDRFLSEHWSDLLQGNNTVPGLFPDSACHYCDISHDNRFFSDGSLVGNSDLDEDILQIDHFHGSEHRKISLLGSSVHALH